MNGIRPRGRLVAVEIDARSIAGGPAYIDQERAAAIRDLIAENLFAPEGRNSEAYRLRLSVVERKLVLEITDADHAPVISHILSLTPLRRVVRDYFILCESFYAAVPTATPNASALGNTKSSSRCAWTCPKPHWPSQVTAAGVSCSTFSATPVR